jgi:hypothetical protein
VAAIAGPVVAIVIASGDDAGDAPPAYDFTEPAAVFQAVIDAARTGDTTALPGLCLGDAEDMALAMCEMTPFSSKWDEFRALFLDAVVEGTYLSEDSAIVSLRYGPGGRSRANVRLVLRRDRFYLKQF